MLFMNGKPQLRAKNNNEKAGVISDPLGQPLIQSVTIIIST